MAIRRRRKKLTSLVSRLDERVRSVELRPINLLTSGQVDAAVEIGEATAQPTNVVSGTAPNEFRKVQDAYYYSKALTGGSEDRVAIYLESDLDLEVGETLEISGIHGTNDTDIDVSGTFEVKFADTPPWDDRESWKHDPTQDQLAGVTITNEYSVKPETLGPATWGSAARRLQTKRLVDTFSITDTTVTLTMNATHKFKVDDVIFVDIFAEDSRAYGADGLFKITAVTSDTIEYELAAGVDTPTGTVTPSADVYVFPVARNFIPTGSTWSDSSTNKIYVWDGVRWVDYSAADVTADGDPPSAPTNFTISDVPALVTTQYVPYSKVTLSWTAPTTSESGDPITDLLGYRIRWRRSVSEDWREKDVRNPSATSYTFDDDVLLEQGTTYYFELYAYDSGLQDSSAATANHTTDQLTGDIETYPPSDPILSSRLGTITVTWNGFLKTSPSTFTAAPEDVVLMKIYVDTTSSTFTPSPSNLQKSVRVWGSDGGFDVLTDLAYDTSYYVKITVVNTSGFESDPSATATGQVTPLVDADIVYSTLNNWPFNNGTIPANALADGSINASNMFGSDVIVQDAIAANAIGADQIAAGSIIAGKIGANAITAANINAAAITSDKIASNAITAIKINAGAITAVKISANAITADKITAGAITAVKLDAESVTADKLESDLTLSNIIKTGPAGSARIEIRGEDHPNPGIVSLDGVGGTSFRFYSNGVSYLDSVIADDVSGGLFTGGTFRTSAGTYGRVNMTSSSTYGTQGAVNFESSNQSIRGYTGIGVSSTLSLGSYALADADTDLVYVNKLDGRLQNNSSVSDARLKEEIENLNLGLDFINELRPVKFVWKQDHRNKQQWGFIAQEGRSALENNGVDLNNNPISKIDHARTVDGENGKEGSFTFQNAKLVPVLVQAVKDLTSQLEELRAKVEYLEGR